MKRKHNTTTLSMLFRYHRERTKKFEKIHILFIDSYKREKVEIERLAKEQIMYIKQDTEFIELIADNYNDDNYILDEISRHHIMSMIISNAANIEKFLINLSFAIRDLENLSNGPNGNISINGFTDSLMAASYIQNAINLDFDQLENKDNKKLWPKIKAVRDIRHLPAHGNYEFALKTGKLNSYNSIFSNNKPLIEKIRAVNKKEQHCRLTSNYNVVNILNIDSLNFIQILHDMIMPLYSKKE